MAEGPSTATSRKLSPAERARREGGPWPRRFLASPAALALALAVGTGGGLWLVEPNTHEMLTIARVADGSAPTLDGDGSDAIWSGVESVTILTRGGANLPPRGESRVEVSALADATNVYFRFRWQDPTHSLKHLPLQKTQAGWRLLHEEFDVEDEDVYYEDKLAVMLSRDAAVGGGSTHLGPKPLDDKPGGLSGRGLHYTTDGTIRDVWHWKAARGGTLGYMDDNVFGAPAEPKPAEAEGKARYKGGYAADPGTQGIALNFKSEPPGGYRDETLPTRLPKNATALTARLGLTADDPHGPAGEVWAMREDESLPYSQELDDAIPVGTVVPGVLVKGNGRYEGDRADVRAGARWADGYWTLELARRLDTGSDVDLPILADERLYLWVSVFDHTQTRHSRHTRPIVLYLPPLSATHVAER